MSACESSSCMNTRTHAHTDRHTSSHIPDSVLWCRVASAHQADRPALTAWSERCRQGRKKHRFYNAPNHNNKQPTGHEQCSTQDHQPCFWPFWCCVTDGWATPAYASLTLPGNRALTIHWSATLIPPFKYFVGLLEQLWWGMNSKKNPLRFMT